MIGLPAILEDGHSLALCFVIGETQGYLFFLENRAILIPLHIFNCDKYNVWLEYTHLTYISIALYLILMCSVMMRT